MLTIPKHIYQQMLEQAEAEAPMEACGILAGRDSRVERFYGMTNADNSSDHFMMEPKEQFAAAKDIRKEGLEMLAVCHSHPQTPARPSEEDGRLALTENVIYVILSLQDSANPDVKGFIIENGSVTEVPITVESIQ